MPLHRLRRPMSGIGMEPRGGQLGPLTVDGKWVRLGSFREMDGRLFALTVLG